MAVPSAAPRYTSPAIAAHWLAALLIFGGFGLGQFMTGLPTSPDKLQFYAWHKWIGVTVFLLALFRVGWRTTHPAPPLPVGISSWQRTAARAALLVLYVLMFLIPLSGWLYSSASGFQTFYLGLIPLPDLIGKNKALAETFETAHVALNNVLLFVVLAHFAAAAKHHWVERNGLLHRITPGREGHPGGPALATGFGFVALAACLWLGFGSEEPEGEAAPVAVEAAAGQALSPVPGTLHARFTQMGVGVDLEFKVFEARITFDETDPAAGSVSVEVDATSADLGDDSYNQELAGPDWLDSANHPRAVFESKALRAAGGAFEAEGSMTLKGVTQPVTIPFTVTREGELRSFEGQFPISRRAFGVGDPSWDEDLEDQVVVRFQVQAP